MARTKRSSGHHLARNNFVAAADQEFESGGLRYRLGGKIGDGAVGVVRKATRRRDGKVVAVKFLAPDPKYIDVDRFADVAQRFQREGQRGPKLRHHSVVQIHAYEENEGATAFSGNGPTNPFILMEHVPGRTLESYIRRRPAREKEAFVVSTEKLVVAFQLAQALEYLHSKKLVHRDVKPANVFLTKHRDTIHVRLGDFGVLKWGDFHAAMSTGVLTATNQEGLGTMKYMSPEQAVRPKEVTVRSDIYSLGITLFELFTGQILVSPHHVFEVMTARLARGTTASRYLSMGYTVAGEHIDLAEMLLDMHLRGATGRPATSKVRGRLEYALERAS